MIDHDLIRGMLPLYAMSVLDGDEATMLRAHLHDCPDCPTEMGRYQTVTALLIPDGPPPAYLWNRIGAVLEDDGHQDA